MAKEICTVCGREIDSRGLSGHMKTHKAKSDKVLYGHEGEDNGVISYPSNEQEIGNETQAEQPVLQNRAKKTETVKKPVKKPVKKTVTSKPASKPASSPQDTPQDPRGQRKSDEEHKKEWQGFFR